MSPASTRPNWRFLIGEFVVIVMGVLVALWVDGLQTTRAEARLEIEYLESLLIDLETDLAQFDSADAWSRRQEAAAATVLALYEGERPSEDVSELVAAVNTIVRAETEQWIADFQSRLKGLDEATKAAEKAQEASRPGALNINVSNGASCEDGWTLKAGGKVRTGRGTSAALDGLSPGPTIVRVEGQVAGQPKADEKVVVVLPGQTVTDTLTLA